MGDKISAKILLVEDNIVNQKVAMKMLEKMGCQVESAFNGRQGVEKLLNGNYDLVFMDCQMPEMDGFEATAVIRKREGQVRHTPVVAMTANAMAGDRQKCLDAGMDDYVSKPICREDLLTVLDRWVTREGVQNSSEVGKELPLQSEMASSSTKASIDYQVIENLKDLLGEEFKETVDLFLEHTPILLDSVRKALSLGDATAAFQSAHTLKGSATNMGAMSLSSLSKDLEKAGRTGTLNGAEGLLEEMQAEYGRVKNVLKNACKIVGNDA